MYRLMISFSSSLENEFGVSVKPKEYVLQDADEVCKVIKGLSHLQPIVTLQQLSVMSAVDVLKVFELKDV